MKKLLEKWKARLAVNKSLKAKSKEFRYLRNGHCHCLEACIAELEDLIEDQEDGPSESTGNV
jgi:hypothetical protein